ncbi:MAG: metallophosphoesterase family protein [Deltaproteobacteria bacterium]
MSRTFVIGDIHGCPRAVVDRLALINADPDQDGLVFLGDYVDRGPDTRRVIDVLLSLQQEFRRMVTLKGNHEEVLLNFLAGRDREFFLAIGGRETLRSYGCTEPFDYSCTLDIPNSHQQFLYNLLPYWQDEHGIYVHAGLQPGIHLTQQSPDWLYWADGGKFAAQRYDFGKRVIFGHSVVLSPLIEPGKVGLDTGCVYGGSLSCLVLPDMEFVQVPCQKYWPPGR